MQFDDQRNELKKYIDEDVRSHYVDERKLNKYQLDEKLIYITNNLWKKFQETIAPTRKKIQDIESEVLLNRFKLDEALKNLYKPSGEKFVLDLTDIDSHPAVSGLSKTMKQERDARKKSDKALKDFETLTNGLDLEKLKEIDLGEYTTAIADLEKFKDADIKRNKKKLKDKAEWEKLEQQLQDEQTEVLETLQSKHKQELSVFKTKLEEVNTAKTEEIGNMHLALEKQLKDKEIIAAIAEAKGNIPILMPHVSEFIKVLKDDTGDYAARVTDSNGTVRINDEGKSMTISEFVTELREKKEFQGEGIFAKDQQSGGSGSEGNQDAGETGEKNPFSEKHFNLTEQGRLFKTNLAEYNRLKKAAGKG